jgi:hypothetical protein
MDLEVGMGIDMRMNTTEERDRATERFQQKRFDTVNDLMNGLGDLQLAGVYEVKGPSGRQTIPEIKRGIDQAALMVDAAFREGKPIDIAEACRTVTRALGIREKAIDALSERMWCMHII